MTKGRWAPFSVNRIIQLLLWGLVFLSVCVRILVAPYERPLPIASQGERFEVAKGAGLLQIAYQFEDKSWVAMPRLFTLYGQLFGYAEVIKAGEYQIVPGTTLKALLAKMKKGDVITYQVTFVEGQSYRDYLRILASTDGIKKTLATNDVDAVMKALGDTRSSPEGLLFPDTYFYEKGETDVDILKRAYRHMQDALTKEWVSRAEGLPYNSPYEALVMASIIEKESGVEAERERIAGVFVRRLQKGMRLQTDPTVIYGLGGEYNGNLTRQHLMTPNPYNTYLNTGLPPTPIANPGIASIRAAMNPEPGEVLYFVATGEGKHQFSITLEEHEKAVDEYQRKRRTDYRSAPTR